MKSEFIDKLIERLDRMDPGSLQTQFLHLAREKGLMETIFHAIQEGVVVLDPQARIVYANRAAERLLGFDLDADVGAPIRRFLRAIEWEGVLRLDEAEWSRLIRREIEVRYPEHRFLTFYVVPLQGESPEGGGAVVILRDVTRDRLEEAQSLASERLRAIMLLAAGVAHEIGNPLNSLTIHLQLLQRELSSVKDAAAREGLDELVQVSLRETSRLDQILTRFLKAVRPVKPRMESVDLRALAGDTVTFLRHEIEDRSVRVELMMDDLPPLVRGDPNQIRQAFFNLVKNAVEAMPDGGRLEIRLGHTDHFVLISFRDNGTGIPADEMSRIFDPYYTTKASGSGLGMMIVQRIVQDHGGEIEVESKPGEGTTLTLLFPREDRLVRLLKAPDRVDGERPAAGDEPSGAREGAG